MKTIEYLYPEYSFIFAENWNVEYLKRSSNEITVVETNHKDEPYFVKNKVDMIYLGCFTERKQEEVISLLMPFKDKIIELIKNGTIFLITGNSIEIFGEYILDGDKKIEALNIFNYYSKRYMDIVRHNSLFVGEYNGQKLIGHRSQFSFTYGDISNPFMKVIKGIGMDKDNDIEGINDNNFFATYSLGPFLVVNPYFAKYLLKLMGITTPLIYENEAIEAYDFRLKELMSK